VLELRKEILEPARGYFISASDIAKHLYNPVYNEGTPLSSEWNLMLRSIGVVQNGRISAELQETVACNQIVSRSRRLQRAHEDTESSVHLLVVFAE
jgi:hypothetical protein